MSVEQVHLGPEAGRHPDRRDPLADFARVRAAPRDTLPDSLSHFAEQSPDRPSLYFFDGAGRLEVVSRRELLDRALALAAGLRRMGVGEGDAVILAMETSPALVASFIGCTWIGATPNIGDLPFSKRSVPAWREKLDLRVRALQVRAVIAGTEVLPLLGAPGDRRPVVTTPDELSAGGAQPLAIAARADGLAFVQFTSGTTSTGRAIRLSNRAVMACVRGIAAHRQWLASDLVVNWLPLYHDLGLVGNLLMALTSGIPLALMSPFQFLLEPARWLWATHYLRGTTLIAPNFAFDLCVERIADAELEGLDLSSVRDVYNGGEFIHAGTLRRFDERYRPRGLRGDAWIPSYGMAEMVLCGALRPLGGPLRIDRVSRLELAIHRRAVPAADPGDATEVVSCGRMMEGSAVRIVASDGSELPERSEGSIEVAAPSLFSGYHGEPEATAAVMRGEWLSTGDLGYLADGELFVCGREKDLIIRGGENHHPHAFERAVAKVPGVRPGGVAAIGVANPARGTEDLEIVFETEETDPTRVRAICSQIGEELHRCFGLRPERVTPVAPRTIPKTTSGKIRRRALAESLRSIGCAT